MFCIAQALVYLYCYIIFLHCYKGIFTKQKYIFFTLGLEIDLNQNSTEEKTSFYFPRNTASHRKMTKRASYLNRVLFFADNFSSKKREKTILSPAAAEQTLEKTKNGLCLCLQQDHEARLATFLWDETDFTTDFAFHPTFKVQDILS